MKCRMTHLTVLLALTLSAAPTPQPGLLTAPDPIPEPPEPARSFPEPRNTFWWTRVLHSGWLRRGLPESGQLESLIRQGVLKWTRQPPALLLERWKSPLRA